MRAYHLRKILLKERTYDPFDSAYTKFSFSRIYKALHNTTSMLWAENAEFIADEYYRSSDR